MDFLIKMIWDSDIKRWAAIGAAGMGLVLESDSFDLLVEKVRVAAPEMVGLNLNYKGPLNLHFVAERTDNLEAVG